MPTLSVAVRRMPMVRKPAAAATVTSSGGVVSSTVRWAREICRRDVLVMASQRASRGHDMAADEREGAQHHLVVAGDVAHHYLLEAERAVVSEPLDDRLRIAHQQLGFSRPA